jgi:hypothetical protein
VLSHYFGRARGKHRDSAAALPTGDGLAQLAQLGVNFAS